MGPTGDTKAPPRPMRGSDRAGREGGPHAAACSPRHGRARRNAARIGLSQRGWVDLDGTDRGHQGSPSADAWFGQGRPGGGTTCGRMFAPARARAKERRADRSFSAWMGRSRWDRPGTPSPPLGRCVVRTGGPARAAAPRVLADIDGARAKKRLVVGVSWRGWVDLDGTDRGHQASPSTEALFELGRCGRWCPTTHTQEQVFAIVTRLDKHTWISVFHLIPCIMTRLIVKSMFPLLMPGLDSSGATEQCWNHDMQLRRKTLICIFI